MRSILKNRSNLAGYLIGVVVIFSATLFLYRDILFVPSDSGFYPWASDGLGHIMKATYLDEKLEEGVFYPDLFPNWYLGVQLLRYYPPLSYYLILFLGKIAGGLVSGTNWFIALCAFFGGISWLLYHRWINWTPAIVGGTFFLFLPDNVRVAMSEGNYPRAITTALIPLIVYFLLRSLEEDGSYWHRVGLAICFSAAVVGHAMLAAIYAVVCGVLAVFLWLGKSTSFQKAASAILFTALGISLSGWWLLPSLTGGITGISSEAIIEALFVYPLSDFFNPWLRSGNPEVEYVGVALLTIPILLLPFRRGRCQYTVFFTGVGLAGVLINTYGFNDLFNALPLGSLLFPYRFLGISSFLLLLAIVWQLRNWQKLPFGMILVILVLIAADNAGSLHLIHVRPPRADLVEISEILKSDGGWREATLDQGRMGGSATSYFFTALGNREQVYGWSFYGARAVTTISSLEESLIGGNTPYLLDRLNLLGTDDIVLLHSLPTADLVAQSMPGAGFDEIYTGSTASLYHRDGNPRAVDFTWKAMGIGRSAPIFAYLFPEIIVGSSNFLDDYSLEFLARSDLLVLSGFTWHNRERAETLIQQVSAAGTKVVIDLTGIPEDPLARIPRFLDVWGERIVLAPEPVRVTSQGQEQTLMPFGSDDKLWHATIPQGLDESTITFDYLGEVADLLGYKDINGKPIWFIGINLSYHAFQTGDPLAVELLANVLELRSGAQNDYQTVPLSNYQADQLGYRFEYALDSAETLLFPAAYHEGTRVLVDGAPVQDYSVENMIVFEAPEGRHTATIEREPSSVYWAGKLLSIGSIVILVFSTFRWVISPSKRAKALDSHD